MQRIDNRDTYENPSVEIVEFPVLEIITSSNEGEWDYQG